jgi:hypothetical protein
MKKRQARLLSVMGSRRLRASAPFGFENIAAENIAAENLVIENIAAEAWADVGFEKPRELTWWDWTVFLLHTAAEIEHALMVQYLYAAYSLSESNFQGPQVPPNALQLVNRWRRTILAIAREEMAHMLTVQNLLRFIGGAINLEREDFPFLAFLNPIKLHLEPLGKTSLAKYVAAEMPADPNMPDDLMREIIRRATAAAGGQVINRVGELYDNLIEIFQDGAKLHDGDLQPDTAQNLQAKRNDWQGSNTLLVREVASRAEAVRALTEVAQQGEGSTNPPAGMGLSHFDRLLGIYQEFPETDSTIGPVLWVPTRPLPIDPSTLNRPSQDPQAEQGRITDPASRLWAHLFNTRYRMLLLDLTHALHIEGPMEEGGSFTIRGHLREWTFLEMRGTGAGGLKGLAKKITGLALKEGVPPQESCAGPTFELPYTLALPDRPRDRWRLHLSLIQASRELTESIEQLSGGDPILDDLKAMDAEADSVIQEQ